MSDRAAERELRKIRANLSTKNVPKSTVKKNACTFSTVPRERPTKVSGPTATTYNVSLDAVRPAPAAYTMRMKLPERSTMFTPSPGQYELPKLWSYSPFISKVQRPSQFGGATTGAQSSVMLGFDDSVLKAKGARIAPPTLRRFPLPKAATPGPGEYTQEYIPVSNMRGAQFSKYSARFQQKAKLSPSFGPYERFSSFSPTKEMSYSSSVFLTRHIEAEGDTFDDVVDPKLEQDRKFLQIARQDVARAKLLSMIHS